MPTPRLLGHDDLTGLTEWYHFDPVTEGFGIETVQDVEPIIELNKAVSNAMAAGWKGDMHHVAHIPLSIVLKLAEQGIMTAGAHVLDEKRFRAWLNDSENAHFRVKKGRV